MRRRGRVREALALLLRALGVRPDDPDLHHAAGLAYLDAGQPAAAAAACERALALRPRFPEAAWALGLAHQTMGNRAAAVAALGKALEMKPSLAAARFSLGRIHEEWGYRQEAIAAYRKVKNSAQNTRLGRMAEARALSLEGRDEDLERCLRRALALDPKDAAAHDMLGAVLANSGRFEEAALALERALELAPRMVGAYYDLVRCRRIIPEDAPLIARMRAATSLPNLDPGPLSKLHLAIAKALDDLGDYGGAMESCAAAHAAREAKTPYDAAGFRAGVERMIGLFTPELMARAEAVGSQDPTPVLILGMPRSGTTLCEQILSSHPEVAGGDELQFWKQRGPLIGLDGETGIDAASVRQAASDYLTLLRSIGPKAARVTDKMPVNFQWAGLIHVAFPKATIIHCRRAPIDIALSVHQTYFADWLAMPTGGEALVDYFQAYETLMAHWRRVLPPDRFIEVDYERLVEDPASVVRRLLAAVGLAWDDSCLHPERNGRIVKTASKWQARQPIYRSSVDRWRRYAPYLGPLAALAPRAGPPPEAV